MFIKTVDSKQVWQSPDGQKTIWDVLLEAEGKEYPLKTYSAAIAEKGFEGDVESYLNQRGDRFVRRVVQSPGEARDHSIRAQWAIGQAIALASATMDKKAITMPVIEDYAKELFATVSRVKGEDLTSDMLARAGNYIHNFTQQQPQGA
jgi:hypothetical protein